MMLTFLNTPIYSRNENFDKLSFFKLRGGDGDDSLMTGEGISKEEAAGGGRGRGRGNRRSLGGEGGGGHRGRGMRGRGESPLSRPSQGIASPRKRLERA